MNSNRGQYNSTPMYNLKSVKEEQKRKEEQERAAATERKRYALLSFIVSLLLPALFLVSLLVPSNILRWVFLGLAFVSITLMWVLRAFVQSARNSLTVIYAALAIVIGLALFMNQQPPEARIASSSRLDDTSLFTDPDAGSVNARLSEMATEAPAAEATEEPGNSEAEQKLAMFMAAWQNGLASEMVQYCTPLWVSRQTSPETELFSMLMFNRPLSYVPESISGSVGDSSRIATIKVYYDDLGNTIAKRMHVMMTKVNDVWYVDPSSLDGVIVDEEAEARAQALAEAPQDYPQHTIAPPTPSPEPGSSSGITVYYNADGGKYYHANRTCEAVRSEYWPLTAFSFDLINSQQFKNLKPCTKCNPPARPSVGQ